MKKSVLAIVLVFVLVIACACSKTESIDTTGFIEYSNGEISMFYPEDFVVSEEVYSDGDLYEIFHGTSPEPTGGSFAITYEDMPDVKLKDMDEDAVLAEDIEAYKERYGSDGMTFEKKSFDNNGKRIETSFDITTDFMGTDMKVSFTKVLVQKGDRVYTAVFSCLPEMSEKSLEEQFGVSIKTFKTAD